MKTFKEYVMREDEAAPVGVDPEAWAFASPRMKEILRAQAAGNSFQAPASTPEQPATYKTSQARASQASQARKVGRELGPVQGQTGQGLESIAAGGRVPAHLVSQIPSGDIAPGWDVATKYYKGKDGHVYKK